MKEKDGETGTYHPRQIHYLFSDDDTSEVLNGALLRSLEAQSQSHSLQDQEREFGGSGEVEKIAGKSGEDNTSTTTSSSSSTNKEKDKLPRREKGEEREKEGKREERILIVDITDSGDGIKSISSLSKDWQVLGASIENAPTWDGAEGEDAVAGGLMLKIEGGAVQGTNTNFSSSASSINDGGKRKGKEREGLGVGGLSDSGEIGRGVGSGAGMSGGGGIGEEEMHTLLEGFDKKMAVLRRVVGQHQNLHEGSLNQNQARHRREGSGGSGQGESAAGS